MIAWLRKLFAPPAPARPRPHTVDPRPPKRVPWQLTDERLTQIRNSPAYQRAYGEVLEKRCACILSIAINGDGSQVLFTLAGDQYTSMSDAAEFVEANDHGMSDGCQYLIYWKPLYGNTLYLLGYLPNGETVQRLQDLRGSGHLYYHQRLLTLPHVQGALSA